MLTVQLPFLLDHAPLRAGLEHAVLPVLHNEGEEVGHGGCPELAQGVVVETGIQADHLKLDVYIQIFVKLYYCY